MASWLRDARMRSGLLLGITSALEKTVVLDKGACLPPRVRNKVKVGAKKHRKIETFKAKYFDQQREAFVIKLFGNMGQLSIF